MLPTPFTVEMGTRNSDERLRLVYARADMGCAVTTRRCLDKPGDCPLQVAVGCDEGVRLELCQGDELGIVSRVPTELLCDASALLEHFVTKKRTFNELIRRTR